MNANEKQANNENVFNCEKCLFTTSKESNFNTHLLTRKHFRLTNANEKMPNELCENYACNCGKIYKHLSSLCKHKKTCSGIIIQNPKEENKDKIINLLIKENSEFKNIVLEICKNNNDLQKQMIEICKNSNNTTNINQTNSHNKTFNLQFFLNEQCKDAMNISEFVNTFELQLSDLESIGELGYVEGITKQIVTKLNSMDIYKRPMHCSDAKRETIYVKDEDRWEKEQTNNPKLRQAIKNISFKNMKLVGKWSDAYPDSKSSESRLNDKYMKLVKQTTGGNGDIMDSEDKIIRRIVKEIIIDKV